jgi:predicted transcriptional regulator
MSTMQSTPMGVIGNSDELSGVGFVQLSLLVLFDPELTASQKVLYCILLRFSRNKSMCWPGVERLAKATRSTERTVQRNMDALEKKGLIVRIRRPTKTNTYDLGRFREVYGHGKNCNVIKDEVLDSFLTAGEDKIVEWIVRGREFLSGEFNGEDSDEDPGVDNGPDSDDGIKDSSDEYEYADVDMTLPTSSGLPPAQEIPVIARKNRTFEDALAASKEKQEKSRQAKERRGKRRRDLNKNGPSKKKKGKKPDFPDESIENLFDKRDEYTYKDLEEEWRLAVREAFPKVPGVSPPWTGKQYGIVKNVVQNFEADGVPRGKVFWAFVETIRKWEAFVEKFGIKNYPSVQLVAGYGYTWFPELWSGKEAGGPGGREQARKMRDWDETRATETERKGGLTFL